MAVARSAPFPRIVRDPRVLGGEPTIRGTRVPVRAIVIAFRLHGDPKRLTQTFPALDPAAIEEALAFYEANHEEIERFIAENDGNNSGPDRDES